MIQGFELATSVESLYQFLRYACFGVGLLIIGSLIVFAINYKRNQAEAAEQSPNSMLESAWSFVPLVIFALIFAWGWS